MFLSTLSAGDGEDMLLRAMFAARKRVFVDLLKWGGAGSCGPI
jgi:N-acyl-L-homoserine lactone synthetase